MNSGASPAESPHPAPYVPPAASPTWDDLQLAHASLPEIDLDEVDCSLVFLGGRLRLPLLIDAAGKHAALIPVLTRAAERCGAALAVDLRPEDPHSPAGRAPLSAARSAAPGAALIGVITASEILGGRGASAMGAAALRSALHTAGAAALAVQLDPLPASGSVEGLRAQGLAATLATLAHDLQVPLIVRATDGGITPEAARRLKDRGVDALDAGGRDGSNAAARGMPAFQDWGVPAAVSVINAAAAGLPVIAGRGMRHGLDAARAIAAGAALAGVGEPLLAAARDGEQAAAEWIAQFELELRTAMFLTSSRTLDDLRHRRPVILGATLEWLKRQETWGDSL